MGTRKESSYHPPWVTIGNELMGMMGKVMDMSSSAEVQQLCLCLYVCAWYVCLYRVHVSSRTCSLHAHPQPSTHQSISSAFCRVRLWPKAAWRSWPWPARAQRLAVRGYIRPRRALRLRTCRGGGRGPELPILVRSPQPAVLAAAPALPQRETGSEKRKKIARRKLPNIGPLLHHHQPLSKATRAHSPTPSLRRLPICSTLHLAALFSSRAS